MDWQYQLIHLYEYICQQFCHNLWDYTQRFSNNDRPDFTDEGGLNHLSIRGALQLETEQNVHLSTSKAPNPRSGYE